MASSNFALLKDFAQEQSSDKRRDMLRQATDTLLAGGGAMSTADIAALDKVMEAVASDLSVQVRAELARKLSYSSVPFNRTALKLSLDDIEIARPILERSKSLSQTDLVQVITQKSSDHMMAVTTRPDIGEDVSDALVKHGDDRVVVALLKNQTAKIGEETFERVAERTAQSTVLHAPFVRRQGVPLHLLNDVFLKVESGLRSEILKQYEKVTPAELEAAFERSRMRLSKAYGALPGDFDAARRVVDNMAREKTLTPASLASLFRLGPAKRTVATQAFSKLTDINYEMIDRLIETADLDALAMICRASEFDRALFVTLAMILVAKDEPMDRVGEFSAMYERVPLEAARRAIRFWKVRSKA